MLPRAARVKTSRDFRAIYQRRRSMAMGSFVLHLRKIDEDRPTPLRFGFVISKKIAKKSHDRNLLKRRLREICRTKIIPAARAGRMADVLIVARSGAAEADFHTVETEIDQLCRRAGLL
jgi:ribonuclease P protein component